MGNPIATLISRQLHEAGITCSAGARRHRFEGVFIQRGALPGEAAVYVDITAPAHRASIVETIRETLAGQGYHVELGSEGDALYVSRGEV